MSRSFNVPPTSEPEPELGYPTQDLMEFELTELEEYALESDLDLTF